MNMDYYQHLKKSDLKVWELIDKENKRQASELELIASENYVSPAVLEALASVLSNKYSEGYSGRRYYGGNCNIDALEELAISRAKSLFSCEHVNVQPLSGSPANAAVYSALLNPGDKVLALRLDHGGHLSHGHKVNFSGRLYDFFHYGLDSQGLIDMEEVRRLALSEKPKMIVAGFSAYSRNIDWREFKKIADEVGAYTFADISHIAGLIAGHQLENPVPYFDVVSTTTHKTLRGPRGAIIMCRQEFAKAIDSAVFPGMQGGPHDNMTAAKAVAFQEALEAEFEEYAKQVIVNAQAMATVFKDNGFKIVSGGTDNHLFVIDLRPQGISGKEAENILEKAGISVSRSTIPNDTNPPLNPSGIRLGTPAITTRGFKEGEVIKLAVFMVQLLSKNPTEEEINIIKKKVAAMCEEFPLPTQDIC